MDLEGFFKLLFILGVVTVHSCNNSVILLASILLRVLTNLEIWENLKIALWWLFYPDFSKTGTKSYRGSLSSVCKTWWHRSLVPNSRNLNFLVITWSPSALCIILILWKLGGFCSSEHQNSDLYKNFPKLTKVKQSPHNRKLQLHQFDSTTLLYSHENTLLPLFTAHISQEWCEISIHVALQTCSQLFRNISHHLNELPCSAPQLHNIQKEQIEASRCLFVQVLDLCKQERKAITGLENSCFMTL